MAIVDDINNSRDELNEQGVLNVNDCFVGTIAYIYTYYVNLTTSLIVIFLAFLTFFLDFGTFAQE